MKILFSIFFTLLSQNLLASEVQTFCQSDAASVFNLSQTQTLFLQDEDASYALNTLKREYKKEFDDNCKSEMPVQTLVTKTYESCQARGKKVFKEPNLKVFLNECDKGLTAVKAYFEGKASASTISQDGFIFKNADGTYDLQIRIDSNPPELKKIRLTLPTKSLLDPHFVNPTIYTTQAGIRFNVKGQLDKTNPKKWKMTVTEATKWVYVDPCKKYKSPMGFVSVATIPKEIRSNKSIAANIKKICPNFLEGDDFTNEWLLINPSQASELSFIFGCEQELDGQAEGHGMYRAGKLMRVSKKSINESIETLAKPSECWNENVERLYR